MVSRHTTDSSHPPTSTSILSVKASTTNPAPILPTDEDSGAEPAGPDIANEPSTATTLEITEETEEATPTTRVPAPQTSTPTAPPSQTADSAMPDIRTTTTTIPPPAKSSPEDLEQATPNATDTASPTATENKAAKEDPLPPKEDETPADPQVPPSASDPQVPPSAQGHVYIWQDGDRTRRATLQEDLTVVGADSTPPKDSIIGNTVDGHIVRGQGDGGVEGQPVFRSESGRLMTLPGGVLVALDPEWDKTRTNAFFRANGIKLSRVSALGSLPNAFFIETGSGFASLNLANALAKQEGVEISSPNWWTEAATK